MAKRISELPLLETLDQADEIVVNHSEETFRAPIASIGAAVSADLTGRVETLETDVEELEEQIDNVSVDGGIY